jgi:hypothetical protein
MGRFLLAHTVYYLFIALGVLTAEIAANPLPNQMHIDAITVINGLPRVALPVMGALAVKALLDAQGVLMGQLTLARTVICFQNGLAWRAAAARFEAH